MFQKGYFDLKMVRESEFEVLVEIAVEYQAEKVAEIAENDFFEKKSITCYSTLNNMGSLLLVFLKILKSILGHFTYFFGQSLKNDKKSI